MKRAVFIVLWLTQVAGFANAQPVSNEAMIDTLLFKALDSLQVVRNFDTTGVQIIVNALTPEKQAFCRSALIRYFNRHHIPVFQSPKKTKLSLELFEPKVEYLEPINEITGFGSTITRRISLRIKGWVMPVYSEQGNKALAIVVEKRDQIKKDWVPVLEESPFLFVKGKWVSYSRWTRFLQPTILIGSVSLLVYLFFSLRS